MNSLLFLDYYHFEHTLSTRIFIQIIGYILFCFIVVIVISHLLLLSLNAHKTQDIYGMYLRIESLSIECWIGGVMGEVMWSEVKWRSQYLYLLLQIECEWICKRLKSIFRFFTFPHRTPNVTGNDENNGKANRRMNIFAAATYFDEKFIGFWSVDIRCR